jgi:hypothetical protein
MRRNMQRHRRQEFIRILNTRDRSNPKNARACASWGFTAPRAACIGRIVLSIFAASAKTSVVEVAQPKRRIWMLGEGG